MGLEGVPLPAMVSAERPRVSVKTRGLPLKEMVFWFVSVMLPLVTGALFPFQDTAKIPTPERVWMAGEEVFVTFSLMPDPSVAVLWPLVTGSMPQFEFPVLVETLTL